MLRSYLILNLRDMNDLPVMERWLLKEHAAETISQLDPILERYCSYRAVPAPAGSERFHPYNWRMTEHWWRELPFIEGTFEHGTALTEVWPDRYPEILGLPQGEVRSAGWQGRADGLHPPVFCFVPHRPTEDFKGRKRTLKDGTNLRWVIAHRYPEGVSIEEGEDWFLNVHVPEVVAQKELTRFFSYKVTEPRMGPFVRISELWYENASAWAQAVVHAPPAYTPPGWCRHDRYPFLEPVRDFVCQFLLEAPTDDFKNYLRPYITTA
jgi:hypothetical protein